MKRSTLASPYALMLAAFMFVAPGVMAQQPAPTTDAPAQLLKSEQLDALLAPIALYSDPLLAQVLMASTYPLEVVQAARWQKENKQLTGKPLEDALLKEDWDPSVKALVVVPQVLLMMDEKIDWTQQLGDVFLAQREDVMASVQRLRQLAQNKGNLQSTKEQTVSNRTQNNKSAIVIEPQDPGIAYVPVYNPAVVYGDWPYPEYPPYDYYPYGYHPGAGLAFTTAVIIGAAIWGNCDWWNNRVDIDIDRFNRFNRTNITDRNWSHQVDHRRGVPYRDANVARQFDRNTTTGASRDAARAKAAADIKSREGAKGGQKAGQKAGQKGDLAKAANKGNVNKGNVKQAANTKAKDAGNRAKQAESQKAAQSKKNAVSNKAKAANRTVGKPRMDAIDNVNRGARPNISRGGGVPRQMGGMPGGGGRAMGMGGGRGGGRR